jgi:predicted TIM-barrel fold metal-dependent hydrolase
MIMTDGARRIDVHAHAIPSFLREALAAAGRGATISTGTPAWDAETHLGIMDANGIAASVLSVSQPGVHFGDAAAARRLARHCNSHFAELKDAFPQRFGAFGVTPLPDVDGAAAEAAHALDVLKLDGIGLLASYGEKFLGDPMFDPLLKLLNDRGAVVFIHPNFHPFSRALDLKLPGFLVEFTFDTTRAAVNLIFAGALERFRDIRFVLAHAGGTLPYLAWRLQAGLMIDAQFAHLSAGQVEAAVRHFWYDTALSAGPGMLAALSAVADPGRIVFGSDFPYSPPRLVSLQAATLAENTGPERQRAIGRQNALTLFPRFA